MNPSNGSGFLKSYLELSKKLVKTMVIKSLTAASDLNDYVIATHGESSVNQNDPTSWKYYLNLSGAYHALDTMMTVTSLDTLEVIDFTKENLAIHTATAEAYDYGSRYYYSLLNTYPEQEAVILGILYPCDITTSIAAKDGAILGYPSGLVEPQEQSLMSDLEGFIQRHMARWNVSSFAVSDSLYNLSYHAQLYLTLLPKLLNLRLRRCLTEEAHSFHIRQYLASHGGLDVFLPYMTLKQSLYLYRNINYIERNIGNTYQFKELIQKFLTDRRIPLAEYSIRQLTSFDDKYYPNITARIKPVNTQVNTSEIAFIPIEQLYEKEGNIAYGTNLYYEDQAPQTTLAFKNSNSSVIQTKDLESSMVDYSDAVPDPLDQVLLRQWLYMSSHGLYDAVVNFKDPKTSELRSLKASDALIYFAYITQMSVGYVSDEIPTILCQRFRLPVKPTLQKLLSQVDKNDLDMVGIAMDILQKQPNITVCLSQSMFYKLNYSIYSECLRHWFLIGNTHDLYQRAQVEQLTLQLYGDEQVQLTSSVSTMTEWLAINNLPTYAFDYGQALEIMANIFTEATGYNVDETKSLPAIQRNMIGLLTSLSSYSIQVMYDINDSKIIPMDFPGIRVGNIQEAIGSKVFVPVDNLLAGVTSAEQRDITLPFALNDHLGVDTKDETLFHQELPNAIIGEEEVNTTVEVNLTSFNLAVTYPGQDPAYENAGFFGMENFLALTPEQQKSIKSIY